MVGLADPTETKTKLEADPDGAIEFPRGAAFGSEEGLHNKNKGQG